MNNATRSQSAATLTPALSSGALAEHVIPTVPTFKATEPIVVPVHVVSRGRSVDNESDTNTELAGTLVGTYQIEPPHQQLRELSVVKERQAKLEEQLEDKEKQLEEKERQLEAKERLLDEQLEGQKGEGDELRKERRELQRKEADKVADANKENSDLRALYQAELIDLKAENDRLRKREIVQGQSVQHLQQQAHELEIAQTDFRRALQRHKGESQKYRSNMNDAESRLRDQETRLHDSELMIESLRHKEAMCESKVQSFLHSEAQCEARRENLMREQVQMESQLSELQLQESTFQDEIQSHKEARQQIQAMLREKTHVIENQRNRLSAQQDTINDFNTKAHAPTLAPKDWPKGTNNEKLANAKVQQAKVEAKLQDALARIVELESQLRNNGHQPASRRRSCGSERSVRNRYP